MIKDFLSKNSLELIRENTFSCQIVITDGQGRSGKNMISTILSTMPRVEKMRLDSLLDYIPRYYYLGKLNYDAAIVALKIEADEKLYNTMISRGVNFRFDDYTGVFKGGKKFLYIKRLFQKSEDYAIKRIEHEKPIFQNITHDGLQFIQLFFDAFGQRLKFIHVFRDPVCNIYEQSKRSFGTRIGIDPREFQLTYKYNNASIPIMAEGLEEEYLLANPTERLVLTVNKMFRNNIQGFKDLNDAHKKSVFFIEFEKFVVSPWPYLEQIEKFLGTKCVPMTKKIMRREKCPRKPDVSERKSRILNIEKQLSKKYLLIFHTLLHDYEQREWESWGFGN